MTPVRPPMDFGFPDYDVERRIERVDNDRMELLQCVHDLVTEILNAELKLVRQELDLSKNALGLIAGLPASTVAAWERTANRKEPRFSLLDQVCRSLTDYATEVQKDAPTLRRLSYLIGCLAPVMRDFKRLRTSLGISRERLAQIVGTSQSRIFEWETGRAEPRLSSVRSLCGEMLATRTVD